MEIYMACPITAINKQIMWTKLTWFALFSQRFVLHRLCTAHNHLACMNGILHHHGFLGVKFGFSGETFKETFPVKPLTVWTASPFTLSSITSTQGTVTKTNNVIFSTTTTTTPRQFYSPFPGPPGWAVARRELLDFTVPGKINRGRHIDNPDGHHSIRTNQCPPSPSPIFFTGRMPFLLPNQQHQSIEGN